MEHLTRNQKKLCKQNLETQLRDNQASLETLRTQITGYKNNSETPPATLTKEKDKVESKICSLQKSLQHFESGTYGLDIHTGKPIPFAKLSGFPDLKVNNGSSNHRITTTVGTGQYSPSEQPA